MIETQIKPILFSSEMVRAILQGMKTQTRRVIKTSANIIEWMPIVLNGYGGFCDEHGNPVKCKYNIQDIIWVRETWNTSENVRPQIEEKYIYRADLSKVDGRVQWSGNWKPSIFMPKAAARIFLRITDIRAERLNKISKKDAIEEGINAEVTGDDLYENYAKVGYRWIEARESYKSLWQKINGNWNENPFVWVISFERVEIPKIKNSQC